MKAPGASRGACGAPEVSVAGSARHPGHPVSSLRPRTSRQAPSGQKAAMKFPSRVDPSFWTVGSTRRQFLRAVTSTAVLPSLVAGVEKQRGGTKNEHPRWRVHDVAKIAHGYQVAVADVNADGRPDILALSSEESILEWYENPSWKSHSITTKTRKNISLAPLFRETYPERGLAFASDFALEESDQGGSIWWCQPPDLPDSEWPVRLIGQIPTS